MKKIPSNARRQLAGWLIAALTAACVLPVARLEAVPERMTLTEGYASGIRCPISVVADTSNAEVVAWIDQTAGELPRLDALSAGSACLTLRLLGWFPLKRMDVRVESERTLIPGGQAVGVAIQGEGVLVVGMSDLNGATPSPARLAGLRAGDRIARVDGTALDDAATLARYVAEGRALRLTVLRDGRSLDLEVTPSRDERDEAWRLGAWVRDGTAGMGTLTYYDPDTRAFAALGHAVTDADTGTLIDVRDGVIRPGTITDVRAGQRGDPGELVGGFGTDTLGHIAQNTDFGVYGAADAPIVNPLFPNGLPAMTRDEVRTGPAQIIATVDEAGPRLYECEIVRVSAQDCAAQRGLVIRVTDDRLLARTGGIVQGMSGSPILQNGRIAGAITHVYVSDPTQGFGIFIDWMLEQSDALRSAA